MESSPLFPLSVTKSFDMNKTGIHYADKSLSESQVNKSKTIQRIHYQIKKSIYLDPIVYFLVGFFVLSRISSFLTLDLLRLPVYLPEVIMILFAPYFIRKHGQSFLHVIRKQSVKIIIGFLFLISMIILSHFYNEYGTRYILATSRGYLYIAAFYFIGKYLSVVNYKYVFFASLGSVFSSFIWVHLNPIYKSDSMIYYVNLTALFIVVIVPILRVKYISASAIIPLIIYLGIVSASRRVLFVLFTALLLGFLINLLKSKKPGFKIATLSFFGIIFLLSKHIEKIFYQIVSMDSYLYHRIVEKTIQTFYMGGSLGDQIRYSNLQDVSTYLKTNVFPRGFLTKATDLTGDGLYMDFPLYELFYTFGSILVLPVLILIAYKILREMFIHMRQRNDRLSCLIPSVGLLFLSFLFYEGAFLFFTYQAIFTGYILGLLLNKKVHKYYE